MNILYTRWGKDHWNTLLYLESRCVDNKGVINGNHLQTNSNRHPGMNMLGGGENYPTRLKGIETIPGPDYDEWDILDDFETHNLAYNKGTGLNRVYVMSRAGRLLAAQVRWHRMDGEHSSSFEPDFSLLGLYLETTQRFTVAVT